MKVVIISGLSGSGKTVALHALEDQGFYCIDNLPLNLLFKLDEEINKTHSKVAISIDSRNITENKSKLSQIVDKLNNNPNSSCQIIFLDANDKTILKRYSETRRKHPLTNSQTTLQEAINKERKLLSFISSIADYKIDTSETGTSELHEILRKKFTQKSNKMQILLQSFGYKHGLPLDADFIFDVRCLPNPFWVQELRELNGLDEPVIKYLESKEIVADMLDKISNFLLSVMPEFTKNNRSYINIGIGCTGGQHRSVFITEKLSEKLNLLEKSLVTRHRELINN